MKSKFNFLLKNGDSATLDTANNQLSISTQGGEVNSVTLAYAESRLLQLLLLEPGEIKSRNTIMEYAWENRVVAAGSLNQAIFTLRNLINDGRDHELLQTVPRRGYRFNASYVPDETGNAPSPAGDETSPEDLGEPGKAEVMPIEPELPRVFRQEGKPFEWRVLLVPAYVLMFCLLAVVFSYRSGLFDGVGSELVVKSVGIGQVTYRFIGIDEQELARNMAEFKAVLETRDEHLSGEVWVNKSNRLYDLSCVRADGQTGNLMFSEDNKMGDLKLEMVRKCLGSGL